MENSWIEVRICPSLTERCLGDARIDRLLRHVLGPHGGFAAEDETALFSRDWRIVRQRPKIKEKIERIAKSIHKNQREGGAVSMESARILAEDAVRQVYMYENFVPSRLKPKPGTKRGYFERGKGDEIKDKDKIMEEMARGNIPQQETTGKVTSPGGIWLPPSAR